jgi:hypothetical protein
VTAVGDARSTPTIGDRHALALKLRRVGLPLRDIARTTGLSEWTCRRIWRQHLGLALDPIALLFCRSRMLDHIQAQIDAMKRSLFPTRPRR